MVGFSALLLVTQVWRFVDRRDRDHARMESQLDAARSNAHLLAAAQGPEPEPMVVPMAPTPPARYGFERCAALKPERWLPVPAPSEPMERHAWLRDQSERVEPRPSGFSVPQVHVLGWPVLLGFDDGGRIALCVDGSAALTAKLVKQGSSERFDADPVQPGVWRIDSAEHAAMAPLFDPPRLAALEPKGPLYALVMSADHVVLADHGVEGALVAAARAARQFLTTARAQGTEVMPQAPRVWKGGAWQLTEP